MILSVGYCTTHIHIVRVQCLCWHRRFCYYYCYVAIILFVSHYLSELNGGEKFLFFRSSYTMLYYMQRSEHSLNSIQQLEYICFTVLMQTHTHIHASVYNNKYVYKFTKTMCTIIVQMNHKYSMAVFLAVLCSYRQSRASEWEPASQPAKERKGQRTLQLCLYLHSHYHYHPKSICNMKWSVVAINVWTYNVLIPDISKSKLFVC